jgi:hypothetical protein
MSDHLPFRRQDASERRWDGPVPPADPSVPLRPAAGRSRLFERLCAETALAAAARRVTLPAGVAPADSRLQGFAHLLGFYREQGRAWHDCA